MDKGWIRLHRQLEDNPLWLAEPFTKGQAWVDLILLANHQKGEIWVRGNCIKLERGQVGRSEETLAQRWKWSRGKVRNFIKTLEKRQQIEQQKSKVLSVLTVINYDQYQANKPSNSTTERHQNDDRKTSERHQNDTNKKNNNLIMEKCKNEKNITPLPPQGGKRTRVDYGQEFEAFWDGVRRVFPVRTQDTKGDIFKKFEKLRKAGLEMQDIGRACRAYGSMNMDDSKAIGLRRFLEEATVRDYLDERPENVTLKFLQNLSNNQRVLLELEAEDVGLTIEEFVNQKPNEVKELLA